MCDTLVLRSDGITWFARSSDCEPAEAQRLIRLPAVSGDRAATVRISYLRIPQTAHRHGVILSQPVWLWGAEMGVNDQGVAKPCSHLPQRDWWRLNAAGRCGLPATPVLRKVPRANNEEPDMSDLQELFDNNARWAEGIKQEDPDFFAKLARQQAPEYLWIGCSDARVPSNQIVGLLPGDLFVHRNVANVVLHTDLNCLSVIQFAVDVLKVKHILVTGHYGCGGVRAALHHTQLGLIDGWLRTIRDLAYEYRDHLAQFEKEEERVDRLCELNVIRQVANVSHTSIVQNAWHRGQKLSVHGCIYGIKDGIWKDLNVTVSGLDQLPPQYRLRPLGQA